MPASRRSLLAAAVAVALAPEAASFMVPSAGVVRSGVAARAACSRAPGLRMQAVDDKTEVREYFNNEGFNRWNKIYSESDDVNVVQQQIRNGHQVTVDKVLKWIDEDGSATAGKTFCDAGCGVGSLAIPLAQRGAKVRASDISQAMADEGGRRAAAMELKGEVTFETADLESLQGKYDTVTCIDVLIHYPTEKMDAMVGHLCDVAEDRFIISFAPYTWFYQALKTIGSYAPGPSKATRAYLHAEADVVAALEKRGFKVARDEMTAGNFYYSRLLEAKRVK